MPPKRKASTSGINNKAAKMSKLPIDNVPDDPPHRFEYDPADDTDDEYRNNSDGDSDGSVSGEEEDASSDHEVDTGASRVRRRTKVATDLKVAADKAAEKAKRYEELKFIVIAKDNCLPDPFGTRSTTTGKLTNAQLRDAYNARYGKAAGGEKDVCSEAVMKRYRKGKEQIYKDFPGLPQDVIYAQPAPKPSAKQVKKTKKQDKAIPFRPTSFPTLRPTNGEMVIAKVQNDETLKERTNHKNRTPETAKVIEAAPTPKVQSSISRTQKEAIEAADLKLYLEDQWRVSDNEHPAWVQILLAGPDERRMGSVIVPSQDLKSSREYLDLRKHTRVQEIHMTGAPLVAVQRYVQCISPVRLSRLPEHDFALENCDEATGAAVPVCQRITWDFGAILALYEVATQLRDSHVRNLVLDFWKKQSQAKGTFEIDPADLDSLFDRVGSDDPARHFFSQTLWAGGYHPEAIKDVFSPAVVEDIEQRREEGVNTFPFEEEDTEFHGKYHRHPRPTTCYLWKKNTRDQYRLVEVRAIVQRLLLSKGWQLNRIQEAEERIALSLLERFGVKSS